MLASLRGGPRQRVSPPGEGRFESPPATPATAIRFKPTAFRSQSDSLATKGRLLIRHAMSSSGGSREGAALLRWRPNQSLRRRRGRRQLDPSRRGEERRRVRWPTVRFVRGLSTHQGSGCPRRLRTSATAAKCHRGPVDSHRVADQMPTGPSMSRRRAPHAASPLPRG